MACSREDFIRWSVVIPAYNEENRLPAYLHEIQSYFDDRGETYEVIGVDDGSQDRTASVIERFQADAPSVRLIKLGGESGERLRGSYRPVGRTGNTPFIRRCRWRDTYPRARET